MITCIHMYNQVHINVHVTRWYPVSAKCLMNIGLCWSAHRSLLTIWKSNL